MQKTQQKAKFQGKAHGLSCGRLELGEFTNRRLLLDDAVGFRDMPTAHAHEGTYRRRVKVDEVRDSNLPTS